MGACGETVLGVCGDCCLRARCYPKVVLLWSNDGAWATYTKPANDFTRCPCIVLHDIGANASACPAQACMIADTGLVSLVLWIRHAKPTNVPALQCTPTAPGSRSHDWQQGLVLVRVRV